MKPGLLFLGSFFLVGCMEGVKPSARSTATSAPASAPVQRSPYEVGKAEQQELLGMLAPMRKDIVESKD
jgi:hypothetical protein